MRKLYAIAFFLNFFSVSIAQKSFIISGSIRSNKGVFPIEAVKITANKSKKVVASDADGRYSIMVSEDDSILVFSHFSFKNKTAIILKKEDHVINIVLEEKSVELEAVSISAKPETVFGTQKYWVYDYEFWKDYIFVIAYKKSIDQSELLVLDSAQTLIKNVPIPDIPSEFFRDCFGNIHIIGIKSAFQVNLAKENNSVSVLLYKYPIVQFNQFLRPLKGKIDNFYYLQYFGKNDLSVTYYCFNSIEKKTKPFCDVSDQIRLKMYDDESRRMASLISIMDAGMGSPAIEEQIRNSPDFAAQVLYQKPVDAHMVLIKDSVYVFDFYNKKIEVYSSEGNFARKMSAEFGSYKTWEKKLIKDNGLEEIYTLFNTGGYYKVKKINLGDGKLSEEWKIDPQYPKNIKINNGYLYFIYRPFESQQTKYLYKINLAK